MERINYVRKLGDHELQQLTQIFYRSANVICVDIRKESSYGRIEGLITDVLLENPEDFTLRTDTMYMTDYEIDSMFEPQNKQEHDRRIRLYQEKMQEIFGEKYKKDLEIEKRRKSDETDSYSSTDEAGRPQYDRNHGGTVPGTDGARSAVLRGGASKWNMGYRKSPCCVRSRK